MRRNHLIWIIIYTSNFVIYCIVIRARDSAECKAKESGKQQELLQHKLREMQAERTRICNILDGKCREVADLQKEVERLKEDVNMRDIKLKWSQNKLKTEMDLQKETQQKLEKATVITLKSYIYEYVNLCCYFNFVLDQNQ